MTPFSLWLIYNGIFGRVISNGVRVNIQCFQFFGKIQLLTVNPLSFIMNKNIVLVKISEL